MPLLPFAQATLHVRLVVAVMGSADSAGQPPFAPLPLWEVDTLDSGLRLGLHDVIEHLRLLFARVCVTSSVVLHGSYGVPLEPTEV